MFSFFFIYLIFKFFFICLFSSRILYNPQTTASRGMCFVRYRQHSEAQAAISELNGKIPDGGTKPMSVQFSKDPA
jgi:RNA recognition motif-containing protein